MTRFNNDVTTPAERRHAIHDLFRAHEQKLLQPLLEYLETRNDVRLLGPADAKTRAPTVAVAIKGDPEDIANRLANHKVMCWSGNFYAYRLCEALGVDPDLGALRLSFVHYTQKEEVDQLMTCT